MKKIKNLLGLILASLLFLSSCGDQETRLNTEEGYKSINGTEIYFKRLGTGEPVVVVHGGPVLDHSYLLPHLAPLSKDYELIFFDQRLSGRSSADVDSSAVTMQNFIDDIEGLRTALNLDKIHLMGHSWGGMLAMRYAIEYTGNLKSLILLNPMPASAELWQEEQIELAKRTTQEDRQARQDILNSDEYRTNPSKAIEKLLLLSFRQQFYDTSYVDSLDLYIPDDYGTRSRLFGNLMPDLRDYNLYPKLDELSVPTLIMYGADEPAASLSGKKLEETIPNSTLVIIEKSGHFPFIERPGKFFIELRTFLE